MWKLYSALHSKIMMRNMRLLIVSNCSAWSDTNVQCKEWTASRFSWISNFVHLLFDLQIVYILNLQCLSCDLLYWKQEIKQ